MSLLDSINLDDVREKVDGMLLKQYDKRDPVVQSEQELLCYFETGMHFIERLGDTKSSIDEFVSHLLEQMNSIKNVLHELPDSLRYMSNIPSRSSKIQNSTSSLDTILQELKDFAAPTDLSKESSVYSTSFWEVDSDEEEMLFEEIDILMDTQERAEAFKGDKQKFLANSIQCAFRRILELEHAFQRVGI
jgi:hypothetical protein